VGAISSSPLIEHWNGRRWAVVRAPDVRGALVDVAAVSTRDAWAVGWRASGDLLVLHWNGQSWSQVELPAAVRRSQGWPAELAPARVEVPELAVAAVSSDAVWIAGGDRSGARIAHWNGSRWVVAMRLANAYLSDVSATSSRDVWAAGALRDDGLVLHWNGVRWQKFLRSARASGDAGEDQPDGVWFSAIDARSPSDVWIGGVLSQNWCMGYCGYSLLLHWDGRSWRADNGKGLPDWGISAVSGTSAREAWAVGGDDASWWDGEILDHGPGWVARWANGEWDYAALRPGQNVYSMAEVPDAVRPAAGDARRAAWWVVGRSATFHRGYDHFTSTTPLIGRIDCGGGQ
jgi:hypothetical protein